jgi:hypothetical protein
VVSGNEIMATSNRESEPLIGCSAAARIMRRSPQIVHYWAKTGRIPTARRRPFRFRVADVLDALLVAPAPRPTFGRPFGADLARAERALLQKVD